ncbi:MAG: hypothetical protein U9N59_00755 [Campylobacterota bacterium]|nr:hypothetical protein [Campylobacterota bacterium]
MIDNTVKELNDITLQLIKSIELDIEDVKKANHESLVERNNVKLELMDSLTTLKKQLNEELSAQYKNGVDISIYKENIDKLEDKLKELYYANGKLASIILPVKEMYKEIIDEITTNNGGVLVEVMA